MDTNNLIKSVISENIVESKKIATELLMQKLSERLQQKFEEYAPETFLDENTEESEETADDTNDLRLEVEEMMEAKKHKEESEEEESEEEESDEEESEDEESDDEEDMEYEGGIGGNSPYEYEGGTDCEGDCYEDNNAEDMNKKAFRNTGLSEAKKANKDYDGDGKIESSTDEWKGSRSKAIKAAMAKRKKK
jgi:hypothetical protein